jgi:hypothetical protein
LSLRRSFQDKRKGNARKDKIRALPQLYMKGYELHEHTSPLVSVPTIDNILRFSCWNNRPKLPLRLGKPISFSIARKELKYNLQLINENMEVSFSFLTHMLHL